MRIRKQSLRSQLRQAFTLIEIMIVVGIIAMLMAMSIPFAYQALHKQGAVHITGKVGDVCSAARQQAIMTGQPTYVVFHPRERRFEVAGSPAPSQQSAEQGASAAPAATSAVGPDPTRSGVFPGDLIIDMLDVNLIEYKDAEEARVRFNPNGTCDELTLIVHSPKDNWWRKMSLEVTTCQMQVEDDPSKWR